MAGTTVFIGFGEAGQAFALAGVSAYDRKTDDADTRAEKIAHYAAANVVGMDSAKEALATAERIFCVVTADQALLAAQTYAPFIQPGAFWFDMNSVAPGTKRAAAEAITAAGGRYVDVAVMAPVLPAKFNVPLLVAGPHAQAAAEALTDHGFAKVKVAGPNLGDASSIKMIRSVMVKGLEALTAECVMAAERAGVSQAVLASLDASWKEQSWEARADYNLDRMLVHGGRRAAEMEEVAKTLSDLGVEPMMTRGTILRQRTLGILGSPLGGELPDGLGEKLALIKTLEEDKPA